METHSPPRSQRTPLIGGILIGIIIGLVAMSLFSPRTEAVPLPIEAHNSKVPSVVDMLGPKAPRATRLYGPWDLDLIKAVHDSFVVGRNPESPNELHFLLPGQIAAWSNHSGGLGKSMVFEASDLLAAVGYESDELLSGRGLLDLIVQAGATRGEYKSPVGGVVLYAVSPGGSTLYVIDDPEHGETGDPELLAVWGIVRHIAQECESHMRLPDQAR